MRRCGPILALLSLLALCAASVAHAASHGLRGPYVGPDGWTVFTPSTGTGTCTNSGSNYTGTCIAYVDQTNGNDACVSVVPPVSDSPNAANVCKTIAKAVSLTRGQKPDWVLLKKGETWSEHDVAIAGKGRAPNEPFLFGAYPSTVGNRPLVKTSNNYFTILNQGGSNWGNSIAFVGIEFYNNTADPASIDFDPTVANLSSNASIASLLVINYLLVEDCKVSFYTNGFSLHATVPYAYAQSNISFRRNVIVDMWGGQGIYIAGVQGLTFTENLFDHNGWNGNANSNFTANPTSQTLSNPVTPVFTGSNANIAWPSSGNPPNGPPPVNQPVMFAVTGGSLPPEISAGTIYFIKSISTSTAQISATQGGAAITPSNSGSGTMQVGWATTSGAGPNANVFDHNVYNDTDSEGDLTGLLSSATTFEKNIVTNDGSGMQFRTGGTMFNNLWAYNGYPTNFGMRPSTVTYNVVLDGTDQFYPFSALGQGFQITAFQCLAPVGVHTCNPNNSYTSPPGLNPSTISNNLIAHTLSAAGNGISLAGNTSDFANYWAATTGLTISNNVICDWLTPIADNATGAIFSFGSITGGSSYTNGTYGNVALTGSTGSGAKATIVVSGGAVTSVSIPITGATGSQGKGYAVNDNLSAAAANVGGTGSGFSVPVASVAVNTYSNNIVNAASCSGTWSASTYGINHPTPFTAPTRTVETYDSSVLGGPGTLAHFLMLARAQSKDNWNPALTAAQVNSWIRAGYGMSDPP